MTRTHEDVTADIKATTARLNSLASELPDNSFVQFSIGEIQSPYKNANGYITATVGEFK